MNQPTTSSRNEFRSIARRAMTERGLLPDLPPAVLAETAAITGVPTDPAPSVGDLRGLLWISIDNDDSRDLDQLSVAQSMSGGAVKILIAVGPWGCR